MTASSFDLRFLRLAAQLSFVSSSDSFETSIKTSDTLLQLDEDSVRAGRMDERDQRAVRAGPRRFVDQADAFFLQPGEDGADVVDAQGEVVNTGSPLGDVPGNRRVVGSRFEQLDGGLAGRDEVRAHALRRDLLGGLDLEPERVAIELQRLVQVPYGYSNVI